MRRIAILGSTGSIGKSTLDLIARDPRLTQVGRLDFSAPNLERFPCLRLGFEALRAGGSAPGALNAANEIAVAAFLDRRLRCTDIPRVCEDTLARVRVAPLDNFAAVIDCDTGARALARGCASRLHTRSAA